MVRYQENHSLFAFEKGSRTTFKFANGISDKKEYSKNESLISGDVYNMGNRDGSEVVQVYVGKLNSKVKRAEKELKGFQKIEVKKRRKWIGKHLN
jgi:beta-glucosidase